MRRVQIEGVWCSAKSSVGVTQCLQGLAAPPRGSGVRRAPCPASHPVSAGRGVSPMVTVVSLYGIHPVDLQSTAAVPRLNASC